MASQDEKLAKLTKVYEDFLRAIERSPGTFPEFMDTPVNTAQMWLDEILDGYNWSPDKILSGGTLAASNTGLVVVRDMFFHSTCPHHLLPYHGIAHVGYVPGDRIVGLSKIARLVDCFAHRLILQEEMGQSVADALVTHLGAKGAACVLDTEQLCMVIRGVRKQGARAVTVSYAGTLSEDKSAKLEFLQTINAEE